MASRGRRDRQRKPRKKPRKAGNARRESRPVTRHPLYGEIPMVEVRSPSGHVFWDHDPDYAPRLPKGAVRGDVRRQAFCSMCHVPKYFYVDQTRTCVQCERSFVFAATEQKYWYETLQFNFACWSPSSAGARTSR